MNDSVGTEYPISHFVTGASRIKQCVHSESSPIVPHICVSELGLKMAAILSRPQCVKPACLYFINC